MNAISRREFFKKTAADAAIAGFLAAAAGRSAVRQPARPADWQPDLSAPRTHRQGRLRGTAEGHEGRRHRGHRAVQSRLQGVLEPGRRQADPQDPRRQRHEVPERAFHDGLVAPGAGQADRVGAGPRHDHDEHGEPRRPRHQRHDDARGGEAGRRRIQQDRGGGEEGRPAADPAQRGIREFPARGWAAHLPRADGTARSRSRQDAVPDVVDAHDRRSRSCTS